MIKTLRIKFVTMTMILLTIVFICLFSIFITYEIYWLKIMTLDLIEWVAENDSFAEAVKEEEESEAEMNPVYAVLLDKEGTIQEIKASNGKYDKQQIRAVIDGIMEQGSGDFQWKSWIYEIKGKGDMDYIVFTELLLNADEIRWWIGVALLLAVALAMLFGISRFLSRFVTRPAEEMLRREKQFISDASHELKTPVAAIRVNAQALASQSSENRLLNNILTETERMSGLVQELLTFSYLEEQGGKVQKTLFSLSESCEEVALSMESAAYEKDIAFDYAIEADVEYQGNSEEIKHAIAILLDNAIRYTPVHGEIQLKLFLRNKHPVITVYNTGTGIPQEDLPHIFDRFYRVEKERNRKSGSFGLGLSIAKAVAEAHQGKITVRSEYGKDVIFEIQL